LRANAKFCDVCGAQIVSATMPAEYKQVTVLFADVVRSMDIAATVGAERLREIMSDLVSRAARRVQRYGGTVNQFTGDGIMAVFGAPAALEDHAVRACLAALDIQHETQRIAGEVARRDGVDLQLRVGLNSGQVVAGEIGSGLLGYTAIGDQVGLAQRMESIALPGGVMLSESTARLVEDAAMLGEPEMVHIKGADDLVPARRLLGVVRQRSQVSRQELPLIGRQRELDAIADILNQASAGAGRIVRIVGPAGIGKSRLVRETVAIATRRGAGVFSTFCQSHANEIPFHAAGVLLRALFGADDLGADAVRERVRAQLPEADAEDLRLLDDLLGIRDTEVAVPDIEPDARRRRLTRLVNTAALMRTAPGVYVIEDAHWIDEVSESMLADFVSVLSQTHALVLITYRPEYHGRLAEIPDNSTTITLAPLNASQASNLTAELLGSHSSIAELAALIAERAAGNPFFAEEIVRDLAERRVLDGDRGAYVCRRDVTEVTVPATVQATIAARIDRLGTAAKSTLNAAAVIGARFGVDLLTSVLGDAALEELVDAELIDQVMSSPPGEYAFLHPLVRAVAYESQLISGRAQLHRRAAEAIEQRDPGTVEENAALIATHLEAAGDLRTAFGWHMRAAAWSTNRHIGAARLSWQRAREVADRLPPDNPDRAAMRIAPRTLLCASAWRVGGSVADTGFEELRELTTAADDKRSQVIGMSGLLMTLAFHAQLRESSRLASEYVELLESIGDPEMTVGLLFGAIVAKWQAGEMVEALRLAQRAIDLAAGDPAKGNLVVGSPLAMAIAMRGAAASSLGRSGWKDDFDAAIAMARGFDPFSRVLTVMFKSITMLNGVLLPDATTLRDTAEVLELAEQSGDDFTLANAQLARGNVLVHLDSPAERQRGFELFELVRQVALQERLTICAVWSVDIAIAREKIRSGELDDAVELSRAVLNNEFRSGEMVYRGSAATVLVEALLARRAEGDLKEAQAAIDRLGAVPTDPGFVLNELPLLRMRALLARAQNDKPTYQEFVERYRSIAVSCGFNGHIAIADAMT
jgi:adenylate cyclase